MIGCSSRSRGRPGSSSQRPTLPVAVDSRIELFPNDVWADYLTVTQGGDGWEDVLAAWAPTLVIATDDAFAARLAAAGWTELHADEDGTVMRAPGRQGHRACRTIGAVHRLHRLLESADDRADLDVVVLGGGGHVGLPLSLAFAEAGLRVGIYDTNQATLDRIAGGEMPFLENGADELLREILPTGRLELGADARR